MACGHAENRPVLRGAHEFNVLTQPRQPECTRCRPTPACAFTAFWRSRSHSADSREKKSLQSVVPPSEKVDPRTIVLRVGLQVGLVLRRLGSFHNLENVDWPSSRNVSHRKSLICLCLAVSKNKQSRKKWTSTRKRFLSRNWCYVAVVQQLT